MANWIRKTGLAVVLTAGFAAATSAAQAAPTALLFDDNGFSIDGDGSDETFTLKQSGPDILVTGPPGFNDPDGSGVQCAVTADTTTVTCSDAVVTRTFVNGGGGNDTLVDERLVHDTDLSDTDALLGGDGDDVLTISPRAGAQQITLNGMTGNDSLNSADGSAGDINDCGDGIDTVVTESGDTTRADCENVTLSGAGAPSPGSGPGPVAPAGPPVRIGSRGEVSRRRVALPLTCARTAVGACRGELTLTARLRRRARRLTEIGSRTIRLTPGRRTTVRVTLTRAAVDRLADVDHLNARVEVTARDDTGASRMSARTVELEAG